MGAEKTDRLVQSESAYKIYGTVIFNFSHV